MTRLLVHVEGETEESFVNEILAPHLCSRGFSKVSARLIGNARQRGPTRWNQAVVHGAKGYCQSLTGRQGKHCYHFCHVATAHSTAFQEQVPNCTGQKKMIILQTEIRKMSSYS